jgi:hypothetical protein
LGDRSNGITIITFQQHGTNKSLLKLDNLGINLLDSGKCRILLTCFNSEHIDKGNHWNSIPNLANSYHRNDRVNEMTRVNYFCLSKSITPPVKTNINNAATP